MPTAARRRCAARDCPEPVGPGANRVRCNPHRLELSHARHTFDAALADLYRLADQSWRTAAWADPDVPRSRVDPTWRLEAE